MLSAISSSLCGEHLRPFFSPRGWQEQENYRQLGLLFLLPDPSFKHWAQPSRLSCRSYGDTTELWVRRGGRQPVHPQAAAATDGIWEGLAGRMRQRSEAGAYQKEGYLGTATRA